MTGTGHPELRTTRQRRAVQAALERAAGFRTAQQIHEDLRVRGERVGLTTVYRTLQALADGGTVDLLRTPDGEAAYRRCTGGHHYHLVCRRCARTVEVAGPVVERWARQVAEEHGFVDASPTVEVFGTCPDCGGHPAAH